MCKSLLMRTYVKAEPRKKKQSMAIIGLVIFSVGGAVGTLAVLFGGGGSSSDTYHQEKKLDDCMYF